MPMPREDEQATTRELLIGQTGRIRWSELQRAFAQGIALRVSPEVDLIDVAEAIVGDDKVRVEAWMQAGTVAAVDAEQARDWLARDPGNLWAVVAAPWVLIQERKE